jgi:hypothetical protein
MFGVTEYYALLAAWHGWYSLEIGVEIAAAVVTGFASWLLFALLYDTAGRARPIYCEAPRHERASYDASQGAP